MRFRPIALAAALVLATASPAAAFSLDDIDWGNLGFDKSFEIMYGEGGSTGIGTYQSLALSGRQDLFWIFALRLGAMGNLTRETPTAANMALGYGIRGDALITTGKLIPGIQAYGGVGVQMYNQRSATDVQFATRQGLVVGIRALFLQLESRIESVPGPGAGIFGGMFFEY